MAYICNVDEDSAVKGNDYVTTVHNRVKSLTSSLTAPPPIASSAASASALSAISAFNAGYVTSKLTRFTCYNVTRMYCIYYSPLSMHVCAKLEEDAIKVSDDPVQQQEFLQVHRRFHCITLH
jgi:phage-related tail protein